MERSEPDVPVDYLSMKSATERTFWEVQSFLIEIIIDSPNARTRENVIIWSCL